MRLGLFRPFNLQIQVALLVLWFAIAAGVIFVGSRTEEHNPPAGLLLLGLGLAGPGILAAMALLRPALREHIVDPRQEAEPRTRAHLAALCVLGLAGAIMVGSALDRLL